MRLINVETMKLEEYLGSQIPPYAILSHCWGTEEVTFQDITGSGWRRIRGASKIKRSSSICHEHGLRYIWIDTCCIDKSSSSELSESINSMYNWYANSAVCFAYLEDIDSSKGRELIRKSKWFTRGWTLQELIAPGQVEFFDRQWMLIGKKLDLSSLLSDITSIPEDILEDPSGLIFCSVARKMSWAAHRETTQEEDIAYCLLGIFGVNMPLLYGEGARAFTRLQEEIIKEVDDQSLFAWGFPNPNSMQNDDCFLGDGAGVLAIHPVDFAMSQNIIPFPSKSVVQPYSMTNKGLRIELPLVKVINESEIHWTALLDCHYEDDFSAVIGFSLEKTEKTSEFLRSSKIATRRYPIELMKEAELRTVFIRKQLSKRGSKKSTRKCLIRVKSIQPNEYTMIRLEGHNTKWNRDTMVLNMTFEFQERDRQYASSTIMFLDDHINSSFAVIIGIRQGQLSVPYPYGLAKMVNILPKPGNVTLDEWKTECKGATIDWDGTREKEVQLYKLPNDSDRDTPLTIKASIAEEEILNQWIDVLDIEMRRDVLIEAANNSKREIFNVLTSYLT
ncbi:hypothetical protein BP5796_12212 [Coleophoma crateriformis]|uniref:Uncharacterized protein n=1 Tax=Coleophoma crateriformis TaxID=565419 RepID=A0A3D8Q8X0_9HELO|nr:hypothetical protein BP5796_12212 [Coleophoma crateriformis]